MISRVLMERYYADKTRRNLIQKLRKGTAQENTQPLTLDDLKELLEFLEAGKKTNG